MTTAELRADAEMVTRAPPLCRCDKAGCCVGAATRVARAWLADHPPDDDEPVTTDRLRAIPGAQAHGQLTCWGESARVAYGPRFGVTGPPTWTYTAGEPGSVRLPAPATMGAARRLLASLGILTVPNPEE